MNFRANCFFSLALVAVTLIILDGCKSEKNEDPIPQTSEQEQVLKILTSGTATWALPTSNGVTVAGVDVTTEFFSGFTIRFTNNQLFTTGTTPVWLRQDTWQFKPGSASVIIRGQDNKEVTIESISETQLRLSLDWTITTFGGRTTSLPGRYSFLMTK